MMNQLAAGFPNVALRQNALTTPAQHAPQQAQDLLPGELRRLGIPQETWGAIGQSVHGHVREDQLRQYQDLTDDHRKQFWQNVINGSPIDEALQPQGYDPHGMILQGGGGIPGLDGQQGNDTLAPRASTQNDLEQKTVDTRRGLARLSRIENMLANNPDLINESQSLGGQLRRKSLEFRDWVAPGSLSDEQAQDLSSVSRFRMNVMQNVNLGIKEMTGAQMSEAEASRIMAGMPNQDDGPTVFQSKLQEALYLAKLANARETYWAQRGLPGASWDSVTFSDMEDVLRQRGGEIYNGLIQGGADPEQARQAAAQQLSKEFGL